MSINQKQLLLIDGLGAVVSALMLGVVLVRLEHLIGMPKDILFMLAGLACVFALYSLSSWLFLKKNYSSFLRLIACINLAYCTATLLLMFLYKDQLTTLGLLYFIIEIIIVVSLAIWELKMSFEVDAL